MFVVGFVQLQHGNYHAAGNFHLEKEYIEPRAIFSTWAKFYFVKYFCNARVGGLDEIFVQRKFSAIQSMGHTLMHISMHTFVSCSHHPQNTVSVRAEREIESRLLKKYFLLVCNELEHVQSYTDLNIESVCGYCYR